MTTPVTAPTLRGLPLLGHTVPMFRRPLDFLTRTVREHGDAVTIRLGSEPAMLLSHPDMVEDVLVTNVRSFVRGRQFEKGRDIIGNGMVVSDGEFHLRQRRLAQPAFRSQRIAAYSQIMRSVAAERSGRWHAGDLLDMNVELRAITMEVVTGALFSARMDDARLREVSDCFLQVQQRIMPRLLLPDFVTNAPLPANRRFSEAVGRLRGVITAIIAEYRSSGADHGDLLSMLLLAVDDETDEAMTDEQLSDECITMLLAGYETTAGVLAWTLYCLARHPGVEGRLHEEVEAVVGDGEIQHETVGQLPYTRRVLHEVMRVFPQVWLLSRRANADCTVGGLPVAKGMSVLLAPWVIHRDPRFFDDPERFDPDRWTPERSASVPRYAYLPFGAGVHRCIGEPFAWAEATIVLATLIRRWRFRLEPGSVVHPVAAATLFPDRLSMVLHPREPA